MAEARVPESEYVTQHDIKCVTQELVEKHHTAEQVESFLKFMNHQTHMMSDDGVAMYYSHDYYRWLKKLPVLD